MCVIIIQYKTSVINLPVKRSKRNAPYRRNNIKNRWVSLDVRDSLDVNADQKQSCLF